MATPTDEAQELKRVLDASKQRHRSVERWISKAESAVEQVALEIGGTYAGGKSARVEALVDELTRKTAIVHHRKTILKGSEAEVTSCLETLSAFVQINQLTEFIS